MYECAAVNNASPFCTNHCRTLINCCGYFHSLLKEEENSSLRELKEKKRIHFLHILLIQTAMLM